MELGVKRLIGNHSEIVSFYKDHFISTVDREKFNLWVKEQITYFNQKGKIDSEYSSRKEAFVVQQIFRKQVGRDFVSPPKTVAGLVLKLGPHKIAEVKGFVVDKSLETADVQQCIRLSMKDVEKLCRKGGHKSLLIYSSHGNNTAKILFDTRGFSLIRVSQTNLDLEFTFERVLPPIYSGDPLNWLDKTLWYLEYFVGCSLKGLKYRDGQRLEGNNSPIAQYVKLSPYPLNVYNPCLVRKINTLIIIFGNRPTKEEIENSLEKNQEHELVYIFTRLPLNFTIRNSIIITEEDINKINFELWMGIGALSEQR